MDSNPDPDGVETPRDEEFDFGPDLPPLDPVANFTVLHFAKEPPASIQILSNNSPEATLALGSCYNQGSVYQIFAHGLSAAHAKRAAAHANVSPFIGSTTKQPLLIHLRGVSAELVEFVDAVASDHGKNEVYVVLSGENFATQEKLNQALAALAKFVAEKPRTFTWFGEDKRPSPNLLNESLAQALVAKLSAQ
jgi:hypothetical protein